MSSQAEHIQLKAGQKVRTIFGDIATVRQHIGCRVWLVEYKNEWFHPTKVFPIKEEETTC